MIEKAHWVAMKEKNLLIFLDLTKWNEKVKTQIIKSNFCSTFAQCRKM